MKRLIPAASSAASVDTTTEADGFLYEVPDVGECRVIFTPQGLLIAQTGLQELRHSLLCTYPLRLVHGFPYGDHFAFCTTLICELITLASCRNFASEVGLAGF